MKGWWQDQPLVISAIQHRETEGSERVFDEYVSKAGYNVEQLFHLFAPEKGVMTYYEEKKHGKILDEYLARVKKTGIREIVYTNSHVVTPEKSAENVNFWQLNRNGEPECNYVTYYLMCPNPRGDFFKDLIKNVKELCKHDIDGIFFDGPIDRGCYCKQCQADFKKKFGHSIFDATPYEFNKMRVDIITEHVKILYETIKGIDPTIAVYFNNSALRPDTTGSNTRKIYDYTDILGAEGGFYEPHYGLDSLWRTSAFMKYLEGVIGDPIKERKPIVNFIAANDSGVSLQIKTAGETALSYAHTLAAGANVWYGFHCDALEGMKTPSARKAEEYNKFILEHKDLFAFSTSCARVALMWSESTANYYASSVDKSDFTAAKDSGYKERGDHRISVFAFVDMLERNHVQFDVIDEKAIEKGVLPKYDALILPTVACMSDGNATTIKEYVKNGGNVLGNFDIASYNEDGSFAGESKLADLFGFIGKGETRETGEIYSVTFKACEDPVLAFLEEPHSIMPSPEIKREYSMDVKVLMTTHTPMDSPYSDMPDERYPVYVRHKYGNGYAYYLSGALGETMAKRKVTAYGKLIKGFADYASRPVVRCEDKGLYEVTLRRQENRFLLHLVNMTGAMERPIDKVVPLYDLSFNVNLNGFGENKKDYSIYAVRGGVIEDMSQCDGIVSFKLDKLNEYEIIVIE